MSGQWQPGRVFDPLQDLLTVAARNVLHSHHCNRCGAPRCACARVPCEYRPFDRNARGDAYICGFCIAIEEAQESAT